MNFKTIPRQATAKPDWPNSSAPPPDVGYDGKDGEHGVDGFPATILNIDAGCFVGGRNMLSFDIQSGSGSNGQHGSDGMQGKDGVNAPNGEKLMWGGSRQNTCKTFTSVCFRIYTVKYVRLKLRFLSLFENS